MQTGGLLQRPLLWHEPAFRRRSGLISKSACMEICKVLDFDHWIILRALEVVLRSCKDLRSGLCRTSRAAALSHVPPRVAFNRHCRDCTGLHEDCYDQKCKSNPFKGSREYLRPGSSLSFCGTGRSPLTFEAKGFC